MSPWLVYWILMLDNISMGIWLVFYITIIFSIIYFLYISSKINDEIEKNCPPLIKIRNKTLKICSVILSVAFVMGTLLPDTKQMAAIYLIPKIASNQDIQQLPPKLSKLALEFVNKELDSIKGGSK